MLKTKPLKEITFFDRLSRLTQIQAGKLMGPKAKQLLAEGSRLEFPAWKENYRLTGDKFTLRFPKATVTLFHDPTARGHIGWTCSVCKKICPHIGAAFSLILEEKALLGLSIEPTDNIPLELLDESALVRRMLTERMQRAKTEAMKIKALNPRTPWSDYLVTSPVSGKTYRVALRGLERGDSYCSCPDFRANTLGTCKHILRVTDFIQDRFSKNKLAIPYARAHLGVHVRYGSTPELRLLLPTQPSPELRRLLGPFARQAVDNVHDLMERIRKIRVRDTTVTIYPDAEEMIHRRLFQERIADQVAEIRKDPKNHPLRKTLLKTELLPYQLDGIAFALGAGRAVLADDMGLGKTIQGVGIAEMLAREAGISKVLVICPTSLKSQWRAEIERFCDRSVQLVIGSAPDRASQYQAPAFFTVCNYEQVLRDIGSIEKARWDLIILDEGQRIKNWEAQTSRIVKGLRSPFAWSSPARPWKTGWKNFFQLSPLSMNAISDPRSDSSTNTGKWMKRARFSVIKT